jgi:hypothetical protein
VIDGDYWYEGVGEYSATISLAATSSATVQVWNAASNQLLSSRTVSATQGRVTVTMKYRQVDPGDAPLFSGSGPLSVNPIPPPPGWPIEIRVYSPGKGVVNVYTLGVKELPST